MTISEAGILRRQVEQLKEAFNRGVVFVSGGQDREGETMLKVQGGWIMFIHTLSCLHIGEPSPVRGGEATPQAIWELLEKAEAFLKKVKTERSPYVATASR